ncbi:MAG: hypothetical protein N2114_02830, partial [Candidatus Goldbacteria bacterium]|nr:hypothetical protein [Candidatus Goldiibacteriota bacterium]
MKTRISNIIHIISILFFLCKHVFCQEASIESVTKKSKTFDTDISTLMQQNDAKIRSIQNSLSEIKIKMDEIGQALIELKTEIKLLKEKTAETDNLFQKELIRYSEQLQTMDSNYIQQAKKVTFLENDFKEIKDILKLRVDKMQSWDDILDVLKKEISNNEIEIARLKKEINELKRQYGYSDNIFNSIAFWPYTGITALIVSIITFIVVLIK